jgi:hypothetical protein
VKTEEFIGALAGGVEAVDPAQLRRRFLGALALGSSLAVALSAGFLRLNPVLLHLGTEPQFWVREAFCITLSLVGSTAVHRLGRPGRPLGVVPLGVAAPVAVLWALAVWALISVPPSARLPLILGHTSRACPLLITLLATPPFAAFVWILRGLAPTRLRLAGAAAGFAAGALGALAYTLHCPELAAPFVGVWYLLGMLIPATLGAAMGPRLLRW